MPVGTWSMVRILRLCRRKTALFLGLSYIRIVQKTLPFGGFLPLLHRIAFNHLIGAVIKAGDNRFPHRVALIIKFRGAGQALYSVAFSASMILSESVEPALSMAAAMICMAS